MSYLKEANDKFGANIGTYRKLIRSGKFGKNSLQRLAIAIVEFPLEGDANKLNTEEKFVLNLANELIDSKITILSEQLAERMKDGNISTETEGN